MIERFWSWSNTQVCAITLYLDKGTLLLSAEVLLLCIFITFYIGYKVGNYSRIRSAMKKSRRKK